MTTQDKLQRYLDYLAQDPDNINLLLSISACYQTMGDWQSALDFIHQAETSASSPLPYAVLLAKATLLHHLQQTEEAIALLTELMMHPELTAEVPGRLAVLYFDSNEPLQAAHYSNEALARDPHNYEGRLVRLLLKTLENKASVSEMQALLSINPNDGRLLFALGTILLRQMQVDQALAISLKLATIWPDFYENWLTLGWCYLLKNDLDQALSAFQKALELDDGTADAFAGAALIYALRKNNAKAQEWLEKAHALDPDCELVMLAQLILVHEDDPKEAARQFNKLFPQAVSDLNQYLMRTLLASLSSEGRTIH